jgi:hypothetical protein
MTMHSETDSAGSLHRQESITMMLLVSLADDAQNHPLGVDRGDGQRDRLPDAQPKGVDESETAAIDAVFECGDQAAAVVVNADVGQPFPACLANFFFVNRSQSKPSVLR